MYEYSFTQWVMFFYLYCFLGWCFESAYVSFKEKRWVNRGFMKGPFLPIYGFGAVTVLLAALPVSNYPVAVFFIGALAATALEYVTGMCMEALFKVRYWDYSAQRFQFRGHICLSSSITWGFFSLTMIYGFHRPIAYVMLRIPDNVLLYLTFFMTMVLAADFATSFKTAMDIRHILDKLELLKVEAKKLQEKVIELEQIAANKIIEKKDKEMQRLEDMLLDLKGSITKDNLRMLRRNPSASSKRYRELFEDYRLKLETRALHLREKKKEEKKALSNKKTNDRISKGNTK